MKLALTGLLLTTTLLAGSGADAEVFREYEFLRCTSEHGMTTLKANLRLYPDGRRVLWNNPSEHHEPNVELRFDAEDVAWADNGLAIAVEGSVRSVTSDENDYRPTEVWFEGLRHQGGTQTIDLVALQRPGSSERDEHRNCTVKNVQLLM